MEEEGDIKKTMPPTEGPTSTDEGPTSTEGKSKVVRWGIIQKRNSKDTVLFVCEPGRTDLNEGMTVSYTSTVGKIQGQDVEMASAIKVK